MLDHTAAFGGSPGVSDSQHPENNLVSDQAYDAFNAAADTDFARGEGLIATIYEALRANRELFSRTMLLITYDEHGGLYDHRPPPAAPAPGGGRGPIGRILPRIWHRQVHRFDFTMLGPRVPAVIVSPLIDAGTVDHREHDHASVPSTLRALFAPNAKSLTRRDAWAPPFHDLAKRQLPRTDMPDLSSFVPATPPRGRLGLASPRGGRRRPSQAAGPHAPGSAHARDQRPRSGLALSWRDGGQAGCWRPRRCPTRRHRRWPCAPLSRPTRPWARPCIPAGIARCDRKGPRPGG